MARRYCTVSDIEAIMPPDIFTVGNSLTDTMNSTEINNIIELISSDIDSRLSSFYEIPLRLVKVGDVTDTE